MSNAEYETSGKSNLSCHVGVDIVNLLLLYELFVLFYA